MRPDIPHAEVTDEQLIDLARQRGLFEHESGQNRSPCATSSLELPSPA